MTRAGSATASDVRAWARKLDPDSVSARGELPQLIIRAYNKTHPSRPYIAMSTMPLPGSPEQSARGGRNSRR